MSAIDRLVEFERRGQRGDLQHFFSVGALVAEFQVEQKLSHDYQAAQEIVAVLIQAGVGRATPSYYANARRCNEKINDEDRAWAIKWALKPNHVLIFLRCNEKARKRLRVGVEAGARRGKIFAAEKALQPVKPRRRLNSARRAQEQESVVAFRITGGETEEEMQFKVESLFAAIIRVGYRPRVMATRALEKLEKIENGG